MPTPTTTTSSSPSFSDPILDRLASADSQIKLKAIREVKNKIIGNRTKKIFYLKLGAVPIVASILADADVISDAGVNLIVQSAAVLGSFACGVDAGVRAVLDAGVLPRLFSLLSDGNVKVNSIIYYYCEFLFSMIVRLELWYEIHLIHNLLSFL